MPYPLEDILLYFFFYSFCGWVMETILCSVQERRFVNRGFLNGPICPIYGCGILLLMLALTPVRDHIGNPWLALPVVYVVGTVLASTLEYFTSWAMEKLFHARWWDYSHYRVNWNGRICLPISLLWGVLAAVFLYGVHPAVESLAVRLHEAADWLPGLLAGVFSLLFVVDLVISVHVARGIGSKLDELDKWSELIRAHLDSLQLPTKEAVIGRLEAVYTRYAQNGARLAKDLRGRAEEWRSLSETALRRRLADAAEEWKKRKESAIAGTRALQRRMLQAFPHMNRQGGTAALQDLREYWKAQREKKKERPPHGDPDDNPTDEP